MKINIQAILDREAEKEIEADRADRLRHTGAADSSPGAFKLVHDAIKIASDANSGIVDEKEITLKDLNSQFVQILKNRAVISTRTAFLVEELHGKLSSESPAMAASFLDGELPMPELKAHYDKIQAMTEQASKVYDQVRHVEQHGKLPAVEGPRILAYIADDAKVVKHDIRSLDKLISKTKEKLKFKKGQPKNLERVALWREKIALAEAKRDDLKRTISRMNYDARE